MKLTGVMLGTENAKVLGDFYTKLFGEPGFKQDDWYAFDIGGGSLVIGTHSEVNGKSTMPGRIIITIESDDVKGDFERLSGLGAEVVAEPYQPSVEGGKDAWLATLADPDGNYFQLMSPWEEK